MAVNWTSIGQKLTAILSSPPAMPTPVTPPPGNPGTSFAGISSTGTTVANTPPNPVVPQIPTPNMFPELWNSIKKSPGGQAITQSTANIGQAFRNPNELQGAASAVRGVGSALGMIPEVGPVLEGITKFGAYLIESVDKLKTWTNGLNQANMHFSEFSAAMAQVAVRQKIFDIQMSRERGERRADTAEYLNEGRRALEKQTAPIEDLMGNAKNLVGGLLDNAVALILEPFTPLIKDMNKSLAFMAKLMGKNDVSASEFSNYLKKQGAKAKELAELHGRPKRFDNGGGGDLGNGGGADLGGGGDF